MVYNGIKFQVIRYGRDEEMRNNTNYFTENTNEIIERFKNLRDLGVIMSDDVSFDDHIHKVVVKKIHQKTGLILKTFYSRNQ